jgi:hypothetical protein
MLRRLQRTVVVAAVAVLTTLPLSAAQAATDGCVIVGPFTVICI